MYVTEFVFFVLFFFVSVFSFYFGDVSLIRKHIVVSDSDSELSSSDDGGKKKKKTVSPTSTKKASAATTTVNHEDVVSTDDESDSDDEEYLLRPFYPIFLMVHFLFRVLFFFSSIPKISEVVVGRR